MIKLHQTYGNKDPVWISILHITAVSPYNGGRGLNSFVRVSDVASPYIVIETPEEICQLMEECASQ